MRRTKIVCTIGPSTQSYEAIVKLVHYGMDVARINCSHSTHKDIKDMVEKIRQAAAMESRSVSILLDIQGPKIRIGSFPDKKIKIKEGDKIIVSTEQLKGGCNAKEISVDYPGLIKDIQPKDRILIDDGNIELKVEKIEGIKIYCRVIFGGFLSSNKGVNLPGVKTSIPSLTKKDLEDVKFGLECEVDYIAISFVRTAEDIKMALKIMESEKKSAAIIAKIEGPEAIENIDEIIAVSHSILIARGDLAVEISPEKVPSAQKQIIHKCNSTGAPVILATQMMESMIYNQVPTRAEASDVANGVFDGADALMLSAETASGKYPFSALKITTNIIGQAERDREKLDITKRKLPPIRNIPDSIEYAATQIAKDIKAKAICCITNSGAAAQALSKFRPSVPIFALTAKRDTFQRLALLWGVKAIFIPKEIPFDNKLVFVEKSVVSWWNKYLTHVFDPMKTGDYLVITGGFPRPNWNKTNSINVHVISKMQTSTDC